MIIQSLDGAWRFRQAGSSDWLDGQVPGGVHTDLLALGRIPDPFVGDNELKVQWVAERDWEYQRSFKVDQALLDEEQVFLVCGGLDTLADVYLNDHYLGHVDNMFRGWEWMVKPFLKKGENSLRIIFGSPVRYIQDRQVQLPLIGGGDILGGPHLRKAPCHWGWDWGPKLPPIGVWKTVRLEGYTEARFHNVHIRQEVAEQEAVIHLDLEAKAWQDGPYQVGVTITSPGGEDTQFKDTLVKKDTGGVFSGKLRLKIVNPKLWWPNGFGEQALYAVRVDLRDRDDLLDTRIYQIGLRTIELRQDPDEWGKSFYFVVNGVPVFAKGADWIPADSFPTRLTEEKVEELIRSANQANMNMLRVWGGGYYPEDMFFDLCDRYGILIWQDFMFACGIYPADSAFFENVRMEAVENVRRIRHHACLAIWCGNNEMEQGWCDWGWNNPSDPVNQRLKDGYDRMFHHMLPNLVAAEDPDHSYWPSSASSNMNFEAANKQEQGDCHYWDVWHGRQPFTAYRNQFPRFMSEFGFQALPPLKTIATYAEPADWNMTSYIMEHHQRSRSGNGLMVAQMTDTFRMPKDFSSFVYLSMVLQAEGIRYGVEHWRRHRQRVGGTLIWQLNDCWPVASWSSVDYFGRWKALHYFVKRFYASVLLSVEDFGRVMNVHLTNDTPQIWEGSVCWRVETLDGQVLKSDEEFVRAAALQDTLIGVYHFGYPAEVLVDDTSQRNLVFICELRQGDQLLAQSVTLFAPNKHLALRDPGLVARAALKNDRLELTISTVTLARFVEVELEGTDVVISDNYFDLPAGKSVQLTCPLPEGWDLERAQAALRIRSLFDSY